MDSAFCGSFSKTTFNDLYFLNRGSAHSYSVIYEILDYDIVNVQENIEWEKVYKRYNSSYLLAFMTDSPEKVFSNISENRATMTDTYKGKSIEECRQKHKDAMQISLHRNRIEIFINKHVKFYHDDFSSISTTPFNGYYDLDGNTKQLFILENVKHD